MDENEELARFREAICEDFQMFSTSRKAERERWVVSEFLSIIGADFQEEELRSPEERSKVDVHFRGAAFQVKELTDPNLLRSKLYKEACRSAKGASFVEDISIIGGAQDLPKIEKMTDLIFKAAEYWSRAKKYTSQKKDLDLIFYVTRHRASLVKPEEIGGGVFSKFGWRSISCVNSKQAVVLYSSALAPKFLRDREGSVVKK